MISLLTTDNQNCSLFTHLKDIWSVDQLCLICHSVTPSLGLGFYCCCCSMIVFCGCFWVVFLNLAISGA